jgi:hypothetical protein
MGILGTGSQLDLAAESKLQAEKNAALVLSMTGDQMATTNLMAKAQGDVSVNKGLADLYTSAMDVIKNTGKDIKQNQ